MNIEGIRNPRYLHGGAIDCEVKFSGEDEFMPYTAIADDTSETGQHIWQELQSGKWGEIAPFTVTPELIAAAKDAKRWKSRHGAQNRSRSRSRSNGTVAPGMLAPTQWLVFIRQ